MTEPSELAKAEAVSGDILERLRYTAEHGIFDANDAGKFASASEAADEITALRQRVAQHEADKAAAVAEAKKLGWARGMRNAANICGSLAETTFDDADGFKAATGCEAAIIRAIGKDRPHD